MTELQASRTLVKSPPELWAECSDAASLARHLGRFGEIRITRLDPETAVAWEGERARGTVRIEPAGWGTKVILTAVAEGEEFEEPPKPEMVDEPSKPEIVDEPEMVDEPAEASVGPARKRRFARLRAFLRGPELSAEPPAALEPEPAPVAEQPVPEAQLVTPATSDTEAALAAALDSLGQAHHRPYSRA
jgi:hypothetical protein